MNFTFYNEVDSFSSDRVPMGVWENVKHRPHRGDYMNIAWGTWIVRSVVWKKIDEADVYLSKMNYDL